MRRWGACAALLAIGVLVGGCDLLSGLASHEAVFMATGDPTSGKATALVTLVQNSASLDESRTHGVLAEATASDGSLIVVGSVSEQGDTAIVADKHLEHGAGAFTGFVARVGGDGKTAAWAHTIEGDQPAGDLPPWAEVTAVALDSDGSIVVAGSFTEKSATFDDGKTTLMNPAGAMVASWRQALLARYDASGNVLWAIAPVGETFLEKRIAIDAQHQIWIALKNTGGGLTTCRYAAADGAQVKCDDNGATLLVGGPGFAVYGQVAVAQGQTGAAALAPDGTTKWVHPASFTDLAVDGMGKVYLFTDAGKSSTLTVLDGAGTMTWSGGIVASGPIAGDPSGGVCIAGAGAVSCFDAGGNQRFEEILQNKALSTVTIVGYDQAGDPLYFGIYDIAAPVTSFDLDGHSIN